jgi:hypothetical protein
MKNLLIATVLLASFSTRADITFFEAPESQPIWDSLKAAMAKESKLNGKSSYSVRQVNCYLEASDAKQNICTLVDIMGGKRAISLQGADATKLYNILLPLNPKPDANLTVDETVGALFIDCGPTETCQIGVNDPIVTPAVEDNKWLIDQVVARADYQTLVKAEAAKVDTGDEGEKTMSAVLVKSTSGDPESLRYLVLRKFFKGHSGVSYSMGVLVDLNGTGSAASIVKIQAVDLEKN